MYVINTRNHDNVSTATMLSSRKDNIFCLIPNDKEVFDTLQSSIIVAKSQWVYKLKDDQYIGLSSTGPKIMSGLDWVKDLQESIKFESSNIKCESSDIQILHMLISCYFGLKQLDTWKLVSLDGSYIENITYHYNDINKDLKYDEIICDGCDLARSGFGLVYRPLNSSGNGYHWNCFPDNVDQNLKKHIHENRYKYKY
jgi:hypothetical protein